jgi:predicted ATP-dependent Lon-type protease
MIEKEMHVMVVCGVRKHIFIDRVKKEIPDFSNDKTPTVDVDLYAKFHVSFYKSTVERCKPTVAF